MVEESQLTFKGYHQSNEMSPGHESTISSNFENLTRHCTRIYPPLFSQPIKPFPRAEAKYIVKKEHAAA